MKVASSKIQDFWRRPRRRPKSLSPIRGKRERGLREKINNKQWTM